MWLAVSLPERLQASPKPASEHSAENQRQQVFSKGLCDAKVTDREQGCQLVSQCVDTLLHFAWACAGRTGLSFYGAASSAYSEITQVIRG